MTTGRTLLVAYLSTPGGQDALALGVVLARSLHADLDVCMVLPPPSATAQIAATGNADFAEILDEQATRWLTEATDRVPDDVTATTRVASTTMPPKDWWPKHRRPTARRSWWAAPEADWSDATHSGRSSTTSCTRRRHRWC